MRSIRKEVPKGGAVVVMIATDRELDLILKAIDAAAPTFWQEYRKEYGDLRVALAEARNGKF